jgi:DNA-directed RNA polymerase subunit L
MSYINNLKINKDIISFELNNSSNDVYISLANAIRRTIISDIDVYIIDGTSAQFITNTSMLNNEFLKHRLTLIPIICDLKDINYENLLISCKINNDEDNIKSVYVKDFVCTDNITNEIIDNNIIFKYPDILFAKLKHGNQIIFESKLINNSSENGGSFFSVVSKCIYTFKIDEIEANKISKNMNQTEKTSFNTLEIERVYKKNDNGTPNNYIFSIESIGFYEPLNIVLKGINLLINKLKYIQNEFKNKSSKKVISKDTDDQDIFIFIIDNENETIGNLLSTYLTYNENVLYCGFVIEHPLKKNILIKIKLKDNNNLENIILLIDSNIDFLINILNNILNDIK